MKRLVFTAFLTFTMASSAQADWIYNPDVPPAGRGVLPGDGATLILECGNGGFPMMGLHGHNPGGPQEDFILQIDQNPEDLYFGDCTGAFCWLDMDTMERAEMFWNQLRSGTTLSVGLYRRGTLGTVPVAGASEIIDQIEARDCRF